MKVLAVILAGMVLCGCSSAPATRFYVLNPLDPGLHLAADADHKAPLSVEVASLRLPQYLERPQIVTRSSASRVELAEFEQWGGNLRKNMMRVLAQNLSRLLATPHISVSPNSPRVSPDFRVEVEVTKFERDPDGKVRLSAWWRLSGGEDQKPLTTKITDLESPMIPGGPDLEPTVSAMSTLWGELSQRIGQAIWERVQSRPGP
jgi:uncharacterized lipoprotein YmbA